MSMLAWGVGLLQSLGWQAIGHYVVPIILHRPLRGHWVTIWGVTGVLFSTAVFSLLMMAAGEPPRWEYTPGVSASYFAADAILTGAMHWFDGNSNHDTDLAQARREIKRLTDTYEPGEANQP